MRSEGRSIADALRIRGGAFKLDRPVSCVTYPTFTILVWEPPQYSGDARLQCRINWEYTVECQGVHQSGAPAPPSCTTTEATYVVHPLHQPHGTLQVRLTARGTIHGGGGATALASVSCTINLVTDVSVSWLLPSFVADIPSDTLYCGSTALVLILDALTLCAGGADSIRSFKPHAFHKSDFSVIPEPLALHSTGLSLQGARAEYVNKPHVVYYYVGSMMTVSGKKERSRTGSTALVDQQTLTEVLLRVMDEDATVVLCGIGQTGVRAAAATHALLSEALAVAPDVVPRILCVTFGSPRLQFNDDVRQAVLRRTARLSGNFLHYTGVPNVGDPCSGLSGGSPPRRRLCAYLGIRCGPVLSPSTGHYALASTIAAAGELADEERMECLDVCKHIQILSGILHMSLAMPPLAPQIDSITVAATRSSTVLKVCGENLHVAPSITCMLEVADVPLPAVIKSIATRELKVELNIFGVLATQCTYLGGAPTSSIRVSILLSTDMGCTDPYRLKIPVSLALSTLFFRSGSQPVTWEAGTPMELLEPSLEFLLLCRLATPSAVTLSAVHHQLRAAARAVCYHRGRVGTTNGILILANAIAARFSSSKASSSEVAVPMLDVMSDDTVGSINNTGEGPSQLLKKLLAGLPLLHDASLYAQQLRRLLSVVQLESVFSLPREAPIVLLEAELHASVLTYLQNSRGTCINCDVHEGGLATYLSFSSFYAHIHPLLSSHTDPATAMTAAVDLLSDAAAMWAGCLLHELRLAHVQLRCLAVIGCQGSGCSTLTAALRGVLRERFSSFYGLAFSLREGQLAELERIAFLGMRSSVFIVGEAGDMGSTQFASLVGAVQKIGRNVNNWRQSHSVSVHLLLSKIDECVSGACSSSSPELSADTVRAAVVSSVCAGRWNGEVPVVGVCLAPSVQTISAAFAQLGIQQDPFEFAVSLRSLSVDSLVTLLNPIMLPTPCS